MKEEAIYTLYTFGEKEVEMGTYLPSVLELAAEVMATSK